MRRRRLKYMIKSEINVIPLLDVLLVLLVIFMMIPLKSIQGFEVNLPHGRTMINSITTNKKFLITIEILNSGLYNFISDDESIKNIHLNQLSSAIYNKIRSNPDVTFLIAAAKNIAYDEVIQILNLLNNIGIHSIGMITNPVYLEK